MRLMRGFFFQWAQWTIYKLETESTMAEKTGQLLRVALLKLI